MQSSSNRSILIISGLLTLLVLSGGALALGFHNDWLRSRSGAATPETVSADSHGRAYLRRVTVGRSDETRTVIEHGLNAGDAIVVQPSDALRDGNRVASLAKPMP